MLFCSLPPSTCHDVLDVLSFLIRRLAILCVGCLEIDLCSVAGVVEMLRDGMTSLLPVFEKHRAESTNTIAVLEGYAHVFVCLPHAHLCFKKRVHALKGLACLNCVAAVSSPAATC